MTKAVALRKSGLTSTEVTVIEAPRRSGSRMLPRSSNSASRWRISSPTRNCRWLWPRLSFSDERRRDMAPILSTGLSKGAPRRRRAPALQRRLHFLDVEALDHITDLDVVV